jgi:predicted Zn-dependent protease
MLRSLLNQWIKSGQRAGDARDTSIARAQALRRQGDVEAARELCLEILRDGPDDASVLALLIGIAADERQIEAGLQWAQRALATDPRSVAVNYALGQLWEVAEQHAQA